MRNSGQVCIILDGLDECSKIERKKVLQWIRLMSDHPQNRDSSDSTTCILVSQRDAITSKALHDIPSLKITSKDTRDDIYTYIRSRGSEVQKKFQLNDESTKVMVKLVMEKAGGRLRIHYVRNRMFLSDESVSQGCFFSPNLL